MSHDDDSARVIRQLTRQLQRCTAERDMRSRLLEQEICRRECAEQALAEEKEAHAKTQREATALRLQFNGLRQEFDGLITALTTIDSKYKKLLGQLLDPTSERTCVRGQIIPAVLDFIRCQNEMLILAASDSKLLLNDSHTDLPHDGQVGSDIDNRSALVTDCDRDMVCRGNDDLSASLGGGDDCSDAPSFHDPARTGNSPERQPRKRRRPANAGGRNPLPEGLERRHVTYDAPDDHPELKNAVAVDVLGEHSVERLEAPPLDVYVAVITGKRVRVTLDNGISYETTLLPPSITDGQASDGFIIASAVDKMADHLPSYRQEQRFARCNAIIPRSKLCRWHIQLAGFLAVVAEAMLAEILSSPVIGLDDTVHRLIVPNRRKCLQGRLWAVTRPEAVYYLFTTTREAKWVDELLASYEGAIVGDGCQSHGHILARDVVVAIFCWAHARRYFVEAADTVRRDIMLTYIAKLYEVESAIKDAPADVRVTKRRELAAPILDDIELQLLQWRADPNVLPQSGIGKAVTYALNHWEGLTAYLDIGLAPIDNNHTERCMRRPAQHRNNSLFSASHDGANAYAINMTLIQSAILNDLDPEAYLNDIVEDLHYGRRPPQELTPSAYAKRKNQEQQAKAS